MAEAPGFCRRPCRVTSEYLRLDSGELSHRMSDDDSTTQAETLATSLIHSLSHPQLHLKRLLTYVSKTFPTKSHTNLSRA